MLVSERGTNKLLRSTKSFIKSQNSMACILSFFMRIQMKFLHDIGECVFLIVTKFGSDSTSHSSASCHPKNMQFCNEQIRTQPLFSLPSTSTTCGSARMCRWKNLSISLSQSLYVSISISLYLLLTMAQEWLVWFKYDPLAAFTFRVQRGSDPIVFEITGWTAKERTGSYRDTVVKITALTTIIFITNG